MVGIAEFREKYFCGPVYLSDDDRTLYGFLGNANIFSLRSIGRLLLNPLKTRRAVRDMRARMKLKGIEGNLVGKRFGRKKGGVLCISPDGQLVTLMNNNR